MKLLSLTIRYNSYTFENDGIPAQAHGGKVSFTDGVVETNIILTPSDISDIMEMLSARISNRIRSTAQVSSNQISESVNLGNLLTAEVIEG